MRPRLVPDAMQRVTKWSGAVQIRDRHGPERSRICKKTRKYRDRSNERGACGAAFGSLILRRREAPSRRMRRAIPLPACFETPRACARLLSIRAGEGIVLAGSGPRFRLLFTGKAGGWTAPHARAEARRRRA